MKKKIKIGTGEGAKVKEISYLPIRFTLAILITLVEILAIIAIAISAIVAVSIALVIVIIPAVKKTIYIANSFFPFFYTALHTHQIHTAK